MNLKILSSGSHGNCYILTSLVNKEKIILEVGIAYRKILQGLDFDLSEVVGCLVTHEHL